MRTMNRRRALGTLGSASIATTLGFPTIVRAADPTPLQMGAMATDASGQPFYGVERNFFKDAGFDVKISVMQNTAALGSAVAGGALDIGFGSAIPLAQAHLRGLFFKVIAPAAIYNGNRVNVIMVPKTSPVRVAADLNGKTVAVNGLRDLTQYEMEAWIDRNGGDLKSVKIIETPFSELAVALESGRIAAASFAEPFTTAALATCRIIGDGSATVAKQFAVTNWFASADWLEKNPAVAKRLQTVLLQIAKWANANHAATALIMPKYTQMAPDTVANMSRSILGETKPDPAMLQPVIDIAVKYAPMPYVSAADLIWNG